MMRAQGRRMESWQSCCLMNPRGPAAEQLSLLNLSCLHLGRVEKWRGRCNAEKGGAWQADGGKRVEKTRQEEKAQQATGADIYATPILHIISVPVAITIPSVLVQA